MIEFILELNKDTCSLCKIRKDSVEIPLTEKDLVRLLNDMYNKRPDAFDDISIIRQYKDTAESQQQDIIYLEDTIKAMKRVLYDAEADFYEN